MPVVATVCRPELLVEIEAVAVVPSKAEKFGCAKDDVNKSGLREKQSGEGL